MLSIIIITKNEEKYLPKILGDLKNQIDNNFEIIISDANSKDKTLEIARKYNCKITNGGTPSVGRNNGSKISKGNILVFLDADMRIKSRTFTQSITKKFKTHKYIGSTCKIRPENSNIVENIFFGIIDFWIQTLNILGLGQGRGGCLIVKKEYFIPFNTNITVGEDMDFFKRLRKKGKISMINEITYESKRRYNKLGYFTVLSEWIKSGFCNFFIKKNYNKPRKDIR